MSATRFTFSKVNIFCIDNIIYGWYDKMYSCDTSIVRFINQCSNEDINKIQSLAGAVVKNDWIINESKLQAINETVNKYLNWPTVLGKLLLEFCDRDFKLNGTDFSRTRFIKFLVDIYKENSVWTEHGIRKVYKYGLKPMMFKDDIPIAPFIETASYCDFDRQVFETS